MWAQGSAAATEGGSRVSAIFRRYGNAATSSQENAHVSRAVVGNCDIF